MPTLAELVKTPLSIKQVKKFVGPHIPVIEYSKFAKMKTLPPVVVYLFLTSDGFGHFCAVFRRGETVEVFDSYGIPAESEHSFVTPEVLKHLGERNDFIKELCKSHGWLLNHNATQLQSWDLKVETCGRHVVERVAHRNWGNDEYVRWLRDISKTAGTSPDIVVSYLVE